MPSENNDEQREAQFLTTEHLVLETARTGTIQEAIGRANLFVMSVSSTTVALGFVAQITRMGKPFLFFALIILPVLYFVGVVSIVRAVQVSIEDMFHARGMARIRHYFVERSPAVRPYLMHSTHDDYAGMAVSYGMRQSTLQSFLTMAGMLNVVSSVIAGVFVALAIYAVLDTTELICTLIGMGSFLLSVSLWRWHQVRAWAKVEENLKVLFPSEKSL